MVRRWMLGAAVGMGLVVTTSVMGANRFYIEDQVVLTGSSIDVPVKCENDVKLLGFSFGINYEETKITVTGVTKVGTDADGADFHDGRIDPANGLVGWGCVFDTNGNFADQYLPAGVDQTIAVISVDVADLASDTTTNLVFESVATNPDPTRLVKNVMTDETGKSITTDRAPPTTGLLSLGMGTLTLTTAGPVISEIRNGCGLSGTEFEIVGVNFDYGGLAVTVAGQTAEATLRPDNATIDVVAPVNATVGTVSVAVTTDRGIDTDPTGFTYDKVAPAITGLVDNSGRAGDTFTIEGSDLAQAGTVVTVCGVAVTPTSSTSTAITLVAPGCGSNDWAEVEVCTPSLCGGGDLCASVAEGFFYEEDTTPIFKRGDANGDALTLDTQPDLSDAVFILLWRYAGGDAPTCVDAADVDDNGDVELTDAVYLLYWLYVGGDNPPPPAPGPSGCGPDETPDVVPGGDLGCIEYRGPCGP